MTVHRSTENYAGSETAVLRNLGSVAVGLSWEGDSTLILECKQCQGNDATLKVTKLGRVTVSYK